MAFVKQNTVYNAWRQFSPQYFGSTTTGSNTITRRTTGTDRLMSAVEKAKEEIIAKYLKLPLSDLRVLYDANIVDLDPEQSDYFDRMSHLRLINEAIKRKEGFKDLKEPPKEPDILDIIAQEEE